MNKADDYLHKLRDHKFYLENLCKIKTKEKGFQPFILNEAQKDIFNAMRQYNKIIILKARQLGFSSGIIGFLYVDTITRPGISSAIIGYNKDIVVELFDKIHTLYQSTPKELRPTVHFASKHEMSFPSMGSKIMVLPNTRNVGRGLTLQNCLSGDSKVFIRNGFTKKIKDIKNGDYIVGGKGGLNKVKEIIKQKKDEKLLELEVVGCGNLKLTKDHKILTREYKTGKPIWKKAEDIIVGDWKKKIKNAYIAYPVFPVRNRFKEIKIENTVNEKYLSRSFINKDKIKLDYNLGLLMGWYLAEGTTSCSRTTFSLDKDEVKNFLVLAEKFKGNYVSKISVYYSKISRTAMVSLYGANLTNFINKYFGRTIEKHIDDCVWYWGKEFNKGLLLGLFSGDGYLLKDNAIVLTNTNESIIYQTKKLLISLRYGVSSIYRKESYRYGKKGKDRYDLKLMGQGNYKFRRDFNLKLPVPKNWSWKWRIENNPNVNIGAKTWMRGKNYYWSKIKSIKEVDAEDYVYDIVMEKDPHSFLTTEGVCHNCLATELSSWDDAEHKLGGLAEAVPADGRLIIESCVSGDTLILTDNGLRYMKDLHNWDNNKNGFSEGKLINLDGHYGLQPTSTYYNSGIRKGFKVITKNGYELEMSSVHKLFILNGDELKFVKSKDLKLGDNLVIKYGQELWAKNNDVKNSAYSMGVCLCSKEAKKEIPLNVLTWNRKNTISFIKGLFDANGSYKDNEVYFFNPNKKIIYVLKCLLLNFGIITKTLSNGYELKLDKFYSSIFLNKINFGINKIEVEKVNYNDSQEYIPNIDKIIKKQKKELGIEDKYIKNGNIRYKDLNEILNKCKNKDSAEYIRIKKLYDYKYNYDEIKKIVPIKKNVYDFTVNNGHTVIYNGFVGHQTPQGQGNLYHKLWKTDSGYVKKRYDWWWGYTSEKMKLKRSEIGDLLFDQEYGCDFISTGRNVFDYKIIREHRKNCLEVGDTNKLFGQEVTVRKDGGWTIYREPESDGLYVVGGDVAEGVAGGDYSVATIFNRKTGEEVAMYRGYIAPDMFGVMLDIWGRKYNNALMVVEVNGAGIVTMNIFRDKIYPNPYYRLTKLESIGFGVTDKMGWRTTRGNRSLLIGELIKAMREKDLIIHSKLTLDEMSVFIYNENNDMVPSQSFHDDSIFSVGIALQGFKNVCAHALTQIDETKYLPSNFSY